MTHATILRDETGRPRAPWRLAVFLGSALVAYVALQVVVAPVVAAMGRAVGARLILFPWVAVGALVIAHAVVFGLAETRTWGFAGLNPAAARPGLLLAGAALGAAAIGLPTLLLLGVGWLRVVSASPGSSLGVAMRLLLVLAPAALAEELTFRGYLFATLRECWGPAAALGVTATLFALVHVENPGVSVEAIAMVALAGVFLGAVRLVSCSLYAAWLAHLAWNWTLAAVVHSSVSGLPTPAPDYRVIDVGPAWATGGAWGPEGGAAAGLGMLGALVLLRVHTRRQRQRELA